MTPTAASADATGGAAVSETTSCGWCRDPYCDGDHSGDVAEPLILPADEFAAVKTVAAALTVSDAGCVEAAAAVLERRYPAARPDALDTVISELHSIGRAWRRMAADRSLESHAEPPESAGLGDDTGRPVTGAPGEPRPRAGLVAGDGEDGTDRGNGWLRAHPVTAGILRSQVRAAVYAWQEDPGSDPAAHILGALAPWIEQVTAHAAATPAPALPVAADSEDIREPLGRIAHETYEDWLRQQSRMLPHDAKHLNQWTELTPGLQEAYMRIGHAVALCALTENAVTWDTGCPRCAATLDRAIGERERAEKAEAKLGVIAALCREKPRTMTPADVLRVIGSEERAGNGQ
jgi:hypothetical protein